MQNHKPVELLAIGDVVTDAFIKLADAHVHKNLDEVAQELCVRFGDKIPYESVEVVRAVGNCANAAVSGARLGLASALLSTVGDDEEGKLILKTLAEHGVITDHMATNKDFPTNYHYVLWYGVERTILVKHAPFPYTFPYDLMPKWIYLTSMGETSAKFHDEIATWLDAHPDIGLAFQPGTFQMKLGKEKLATIYKNTNIFFCNVEEAQRILGSIEKDHKILMTELAKLGPKTVVMTDGIDGAYAHDGEKFWFMPVYPHTPFERTGAGDAYASTITACMIKGMTLAEALTWAPINAMSVTQKVGAQAGLLTEAELKEFLAKAPADYKLKEI